jgi:Flp pilus assembly protein TadD
MRAVEAVQTTAQPSAHGVPPAAGRARASWPFLALVLVLVALMFWPALQGAFVYDDLLLVRQNPALRGIEGLSKAIGRPHWSLLDPASAEGIGYWRPLAALALYAGDALGGGRPWGFHVLSLALHLGATAAAFALARALLRSATAAFWVALLFGIHPVQVEAVAWISAVNDPLYGLLALAALLAHLRWRERGSLGVPVAPALFFLAALLAKESAVAVVPMAVALDLGRPVEAARGATARERLSPWARAWLPYALAALAWYAARVGVFGEPTAGFARATTDPAGGPWRQLTLRLELLAGYLQLLVWPASLDLFHQVRPVAPPFDRTILIASLWIAGWLAATLWAWKRNARTAVSGLLILPAGVLPALVRLESLGRFPLAERFLYLSVLGIALLAVLCALRLLPRVPAAMLLAIAAAGSAFASRARIEDWRDELALFRASAASSPRSVYVRWGLGRVLLDQFRRTGDLAALAEARQVIEAGQDLAEETRRDPTLFVTLDDVLQLDLGLGWYFVLCAAARPDECTFEEAELVFRKTLEKFPASEGAHCGLGTALMYQGELDEAETELRRALELKPDHFESLFNLAQLARRRGRWDESAELLERALAVQPDDPDTLLWLGTALAEIGRSGDARSALERAHALAPSEALPMVQLASLLAQEGQYEQALEWVERALAIDGTLGGAHLLLAKVLVQLERMERAVAAFQEACRLMPGEFEPHYLLGMLLARLGQGALARAYLERALEVDPEGEHAGEIRSELARIPADGG